ncbi:MAG: tRNA (N6-threonylcarbamoyladenosine(37)-N6)-methyltransferase TrmO [Planctomycetota bacterium]
MATGLCIDASMGMAGDMFSAALIALGAPAARVADAMTRAGELLGRAAVRAETVEQQGVSGIRLRVELNADAGFLGAREAREVVTEALRKEAVGGAYVEFAQSALEVLLAAEREAHHANAGATTGYRIVPIGVAHTPYETAAPRQPAPGAAGAFSVEVFPAFSAGLMGVESFSHMYVLSYLHRSSGWSLTVTPPWGDPATRRQVGLFASRSPNRPTPLGLTLTEVRAVEGNRIITGPLDLFDGTEVLDLKPHVVSLDRTGVGNDGWLAGTDHLQCHRSGVPHRHDGEGPILHEAADIVLDLVGAAVGMASLDVALDRVVGLMPVAVGGGQVRCSHGVQSVPPPAVVAILNKHRVPHVTGPVNAELLTPTGAALLAALKPRWRARELGPPPGDHRFGYGFGAREFGVPNAVRLSLGPDTG